MSLIIEFPVGKNTYFQGGNQKELQLFMQVIPGKKSFGNISIISPAFFKLPIKKWLVYFSLLTTFTILQFSFINADENTWSTNGPSGGSVKTITIHPFYTQTIYVGTIGGKGIYRSTNGGLYWEGLNPEEFDTNLRVIDIHPFGPDTMFIATARGMFKSTNAGDNWSLMEPPGNPYNEIRALLVHPQYPNIIFAGGPFGNNWKSTDSGNSWFELNTNGRTIGIDDFVLDPNNSNILYFASGSVHLGLGIWKSTDLGENWYSVQNNLDSTGFGEAIAIDPVNSNVIYFARSNHSSGVSGPCVSKSTNGGVSWFDVTPPQLNITIVRDICVSPFNHDNVYLCTRSEGVFKSSDGGQSWEQRSNGLFVNGTNTIEFDTTAGIIYLGTVYGGIYKSINDCESWEKISHNINNAPFRDIEIKNNNYNEIYVIGKASYRSFDGGVSWENLAFDIPILHEPGTFEIDRISENILYMATIHNFYDSTTSTGLYKSFDNGTTWDFFNSGLPSDLSFFDMDISYSDNEPRRIFLASSNGLYYSVDNGESWDVCSNGIPTGSFYNNVEISLTDRNFIIAGDFNSNIYLSENRGENWYSAGAIPNAGNLRDIKIDPNNDNIIYVSSGDYLNKSTNQGVSWHEINNNIPLGDYEIVAGLAINPQNSENLFVCSGGRGIFQSHDGGDYWEPFNMGIDTIIYPGDLVFAPGDTTILYFASSGRSVWSISRSATNIIVNSNLMQSSFDLMSYPNPCNFQSAITYNLIFEMDVLLEVFDILGRKITTLVSEKQHPGAHKITWNFDHIASGFYFYRFQAGKYAETKRVTILK